MPSMPTSAPESQVLWLSGYVRCHQILGLEQLQLPPTPPHTDSDILCLPGDIVPAPGPVLAPTHLQTELVLRCRKETYCDLCVRVAVHLAVHGEQVIL